MKTENYTFLQPPDKTKYNVLSLGAGVQSTAMALMATKGEITPMPDIAIFADTQAEPKISLRSSGMAQGGTTLPCCYCNRREFNRKIPEAIHQEKRWSALYGKGDPTFWYSA